MYTLYMIERYMKLVINHSYNLGIKVVPDVEYRLMAADRITDCTLILG